MLLTKIISSCDKAFVDDDIGKFKRLASVSALGGEKLSFQLLHTDVKEYLPIRPFCEIRLEGELSQYATLRDVRSVPVDRPCTPGQTDEYYLRTAPGIYPDLLTPLRYGGMVVPSRDKLRSVWIEVDIPEGFRGKTVLTVSVIPRSAASGDTSSFGIRDAKPASVETLDIEVLSVGLPEQTTHFTQWFYADCLAAYYNVEVWSDRHFEIIESFARLAKERGRDMIYTPLFTPALNVIEPFERVPTQLVDVSVDNGEYSFGFGNLDRWIDMCDRVGIKYLEISHFFHQDHAVHSAKIYGKRDGVYCQLFGWETLSVDPEYKRFLRACVSAFVEHLKERGDDKRCFYHISDEPSLSVLDHYMEVRNIVADIIEGYPIMDALSDFEFYKQGAVDTPVPVTQHAMPFIEAGVPDLWVYYACNQVIGFSNCYLAMSGARTRSIGMQMYKYGIKGLLHWGYNYYNNRASGDAIDPYIELSGEDWVPAGDTFVVYPGSDGKPLESMRMLSLEEAMQDIRAMQECEKYYSRAEVVAAMEEELGEPITFTRCAHTAEEMHRVRERVNLMIKKAIRRINGEEI